ncbi:peptide transporter Ptr2p [Trichomonascus vanleenenianus]|uniref:peptide transporter Ptr2p n=1 Tax=Trichomonascus vanleenenianus TaxID=2268995 RepID=UPI003ECB68B3
MTTEEEVYRNERQLDEKEVDEVVSNGDETQVEVQAKGPAPTEEELLTLRKVTDDLPLSMWLVAIVELCERFTYYGISGPFQNYMQLSRDDPTQPGGIGLGHQAATALSYFFQFWCYVTPIGGAIVADTWTGKYLAIFIFSCVYIFGNFILFITSLPFSLNSGTKSGIGGLATAMVVIGIGTGGIKCNVGPMIADQYTNTKAFVKTLKSGEKVIVDPNVTIQSIFLIFYFCINFGSLSNIATTELEQRVDFWAAYLLPFCFFFVGIIALVLGRNLYIKRPPQGSVLPNCFRIIAMSCRNKFDLECCKPSVRRANGHSEVPWSDLFVDEVGRALIGCKVFLIYPIYWLVYGQMVNNFVSQAGTMALHGIPNDIMQSVDSIAIIIFIPFTNKVLYPALRRIGIQMKPITRITVGFFCASLSMVYACLLQYFIYQKGECGWQTVDGSREWACKYTNNVHVAIQTPAYVFIAYSEIFASVTGLEYAYTKAPANMKSFIMALFLLTNAGGSALGIALSSVSVDPKVQWLYCGLAVATFIAGILIWIFFRKYNEKEDELNVIDAEYTAEMNEQLKDDIQAIKSHRSHA